MAPTVFQIGPIAVQGYGLMIGIGLVLCYWMLSVEARRKGLEPLARDLSSLYVWMLVAGFIGGKLFFIWTSPEEFAALKKAGDPVQLIGRGFVFYGSLIFCLPTLWWWLRKRRLPVLPSIDTVILAAPVMLGTGRIGCFLGGCCFGCRTDGPLAVVFDQGPMKGIPVHPAQLYETLGCYIVWAILWFFVRRRIRFDGQVVATYFLLYGIERFIVEMWRGDVARSFIVGGENLKVGDPPAGISFSQGVSVLFVILGAIWLVKGLKRAANRPTPRRHQPPMKAATG